MPAGEQHRHHATDHDEGQVGEQKQEIALIARQGRQQQYDADGCDQRVDEQIVTGVGLDAARSLMADLIAS